jgi:hypothetical protein
MSLGRSASKTGLVQRVDRSRAPNRQRTHARRWGRGDPSRGRRASAPRRRPQRLFGRVETPGKAFCTPLTSACSERLLRAPGAARGSWGSSCRDGSSESPPQSRPPASFMRASGNYCDASAAHLAKAHRERRQPARSSGEGSPRAAPTSSADFSLHQLLHTHASDSRRKFNPLTLEQVADDLLDRHPLRLGHRGHPLVSPCRSRRV